MNELMPKSKYVDLKAAYECQDLEQFMDHVFPLNGLLSKPESSSQVPFSVKQTSSLPVGAPFLSLSVFPRLE